MTHPSVSPKDTFVKVAATFFGVGFTRRAPGTAGTVAGLVLAWFIGPYVWLAFLILSTLGFAICKRATAVFSSGDPSCFVLDEVCGVLIPVMFCPKNLFLYGMAFAFFRLFDILKPWPISLIQQWKNPTAIMWDDLLAGVFALALSMAAGFGLAYVLLAAGKG